MTEKYFIKGGIIFKLECRLYLNTYNDSPSYLFKLKQREKRKRKWKDIKGYERKYSATTDIDDILKYLTEDDIIGAAKSEYRRYAPENESRP
jgi:hypothetical protein